MLKRIVLLLAAVLLLSVSCAERQEFPSETHEAERAADFETIANAFYHSIYRVIDKEAGVVCWLYNKGGMDCMPISDTALTFLE